MTESHDRLNLHMAKLGMIIFTNFVQFDLLSARGILAQNLERYFNDSDIVRYMLTARLADYYDTWAPSWYRVNRNYISKQSSNRLCIHKLFGYPLVRKLGFSYAKKMHCIILHADKTAWSIALFVEIVWMPFWGSLLERPETFWEVL